MPDLQIPSLTEELTKAECAAVELARRDPSFFCSYVMTDPETGMNFRQDDIHEQGHALISEFPWAMIETPREHGKTEQFVIGRSIWEMGHNHNLRQKFVTNTDGEAIKRVSAVGDHIDNNERVHRVFPDLKRSKGGMRAIPNSLNFIPQRSASRDSNWSKHSITVQRDVTGTKDASLEGYGILASSTGGRADKLYFDDVCDFENTIKNPALIEKVIMAYLEKWINLLTQTSRVIYVFTRWHERDLSHYLIKNHAKHPDQKPRQEEYAYLKFIIDDKLTSISNLWPHDRLVARRRAIGKRAFARNFQGKAMTDEEAIFGTIEKSIDWSYDIASIPEQWPRFTGVDVGHRSKEDSAYTAIFTGVVTPERRKIPIDIERGQWLPSIAADRIIAHASRNHSQIVLVENNGAQEILIEWTKEKLANLKRSLPIKGFFTGKQKLDEEIGLPGMSVDMENGNWIIPLGDGGEHGRDGEPCKCGFCLWIDEMKSWPIPVFFDIGMASWLFWQAVNTCRIGTGVASTGKRKMKDNIEGFTEADDRSNQLSGQRKATVKRGMDGF